MSNELIKVVDHYNIIVDKNNKCICPFHGDINPSLKFNFKENFWWCFGCQKGGDAFELHKLLQNNKGNSNELDILGKYKKITKGKLDKEVIKYVDGLDSGKKTNNYYRDKLIQAKDYYYGLPKVNWSKIDNEELAYMVYRGYTLSTMKLSGAKLTHRENSYSLIFPILDNGRFKGWVSRTFNPRLSKSRKYLYNTGFKKKYTLAGNYRNTNKVMLVEGYLDMLKARQLGFKKVAALLGWQISEKQVIKLKAEGVNTVISALDNDTCGIKGTELLKHYFDVKRFIYPDGMKDMGDMNIKTLKQVKIQEE